MLELPSDSAFTIPVVGHYERAPSADSETQASSSRTLHYEPKDKHNYVYMGFLLAGIGFLLPYNSFITAVDFYQAKYPESTIIFDMSMVYVTTSFASVLANNCVVELFSMNTRIVFGYGLAFFALTFIAIFDISFELFNTSTGYKVTLLAIGLMAFGCTVQQSSFYGYTSMLPKRYTQAAMVGESVAGFIVSMNRIITKACIDDAKINTLYFFAISIIVVILCFIVYGKIKRSHVVQYYMIPDDSIQPEPEQIQGSPENYPEDSPIIERDDYNDTSTLPMFGESCDLNPSFSKKVLDSLQNFWASVRNISQLKNALQDGIDDRWMICTKIWPFMITIGATYFITLCLFPGIESEVFNCKLKSWTPILLMAAFNLADLIGKALAALPYSWSNPELILGSCSRVILVPLLIMCTLPRDDPIIQGLHWAFVVSALLGLTNGLFGSLPMILAASNVAENEREMAGNIVTFSYSLGLSLGSACAYGLDILLGPPLLKQCP